MMGDQQNEGVIPKAVGEIYDYIQKVCHDWKFLAWIYKVFAGMKSELIPRGHCHIKITLPF